MKTRNLIGLYLVLIFWQVTALAIESPNAYRFERMLPPQTTGWYFDQLSSITNAPDGSFWLADVNGRLQQVNPDGRLMTEFMLDARYRSAVNEIVTAPDGSIWILVFNNQFQHYSTTGNLIGSFEFPDSAFDPNKHMTVAKDGSLWVTRVQQKAYKDRYRGAYHLSQNGSVLSEIACIDTAAITQQQCSSAAGRLNDPSGIALAHDGSLWIADKENHRLQHYTAEGQFIAEVTQFDIGNDRFNFPSNIMVAKDGSLWVMDNANGRLLHFDSEGRFIARTQRDGSGVGYGSLYFSLAEMPDGSVLLNEYHNACCDGTYSVIRQYSRDGSLIARIGQGSQNGQLYAPRSLEIAADNSIWVADTGNHRVQHFDAEGRYLAQIGAPSGSPFKAYLPQAIALAKDGSLWVVDTHNHRLLHFQADGRYIGAITLAENSAPQDIDFKEDGSAWVLVREGSGSWVYEYYSHIYQLDTEEKLSSTFKLADNYKTIMEPPETNQKIAVAADDTLWVSDLNNNILHVRADGSVINQIQDSTPQQTRGFLPLVDGSLWLTDWTENRVQHLAADGKLIAQFGGTGGGVGQFRNLTDVALDKEGSIWVADAGNSRLQKFASKNQSDMPAEYDATNQILYLDDVTVEGNHYQITLQAQHNYFRLLTLQPTLSQYANAAYFDGATQLLTFPLARAFGQDYQGQFKYLGDGLLQLQTATNK